MMTLARWLMAVGGLLLLMGAALYVLARLNLPLGRLPGDIRLEGEGFVVYIPLVSMLLVSLVLTLVLNVLARWLGR